MSNKLNYGQAVCAGFDYLLEKYPDVFVIGQGLWSPWYVGNTMKDIDKKFGLERVIDTPVSEDACTGAAIGASLCGKRPIVIHPRIDFMILAANQIVNQAAKWSSMLGGQANPAVTIRGIINRGGEQGAQHSQALHGWFAHVPGLRVVMPSTPLDARNLLISSVLSNDPVLYIDDRWLYELEDDLGDVEEWDLSRLGPEIRRKGKDITIVAVGYTVLESLKAAQSLASAGVDCEVIDLRILNPYKADLVIESVRKTRNLCVVDGGTKSFGITGEIIAGVFEELGPGAFDSAPIRLATPDAPAPTSKPLEDLYYAEIKAASISKTIANRLKK